MGSLRFWMLEIYEIKYWRLDKYELKLGMDKVEVEVG